MTSDNFIKIFGNVVEHYPAAAIGILKNRPFESAEDIALTVGNYLDSLPLSGAFFKYFPLYVFLTCGFPEKEKILQLHPDLAGKLADLGKLTKESSQEQISAGLDKLTSEEKQKLNSLNEQYVSRNAEGELLQ